MIEPEFLSVLELAERWGQTTRQILEHAMTKGLPVVFPFDGLAIPVDDLWHRGSGACEEKRELEEKQRLIPEWKRRLEINLRGSPDEFEKLTHEEMKKLRHSIDVCEERVEELKDILYRRDRERRKYEYRGYVRALPDTLWCLSQADKIEFPLIANDARFPVKTEDNDGWQVASGRLLSLEPGISRYKSFLSRDDLLVHMAVIKPLEGSESPDEEPESKPKQTQAVQNELILKKIEELGYIPKSLPKPKQGYAGPKKEVLEALMQDHPELFKDTRFKHAWERLRSYGDIADEE